MPGPATAEQVLDDWQSLIVNHALLFSDLLFVERKESELLHFLLAEDLDPGLGCWVAARAFAADGSAAHTTPIYLIRDSFRFWRSAAETCPPSMTKRAFPEPPGSLYQFSTFYQSLLFALCLARGSCSFSQSHPGSIARERCPAGPAGNQ